MTSKRYSPYAERNAAPILDVLETEFRHIERVFEIGSGSGQHAALFAASLTHLEWQPSDRADNIAGIAEWVADSGQPGLLNPVAFDVLADDWPAATPCDAVFSANTAHIMGIAAVEKMFMKVGAALPDEGVFCLYGPFSVQGKFNAPSNAAFDQRLQEEDADMGIRDVAVLDDFAIAGGLQRRRSYAMPANNNLLVWAKEVS